MKTKPIVGYLAHSTSAFCAPLGGLMWVVSFDLHRYRRVLMYVGAAIIVFGVSLFTVDVLEEMPLWWTVGEGPFNVVFGVVIFVLAHRLGERENQNC